MVAGGILILFGEPVPEELAAVSVEHRPQAAPRGRVGPGDVIELAGRRLTVLRAGPLAQENLETMGHLVFYADMPGGAELLPGAVHVAGRLVAPTPGDELSIRAAAADAAPAGPAPSDTAAGRG